MSAPTGIAGDWLVSLPARTLDWDAIDARGTRLAPERVGHLVRDLYGIDGRLEDLARERDQVYRLHTPAGESYVVRVSKATEPIASLHLQNDALRAIAQADAQLPVPRIHSSVHGRAIEAIDAPEGTLRLRVMTYLPGQPILQGPRSPALLANIGRTLARLDNALAAISANRVEFPLLWDVRSAPQLRAFVRFVAGEQRRELADAVLAELQAKGLAHISELPTQVIHNDFNPKNILFEPDGGSVVGIIDFGDIVDAPRAVDLGVTIARHTERSAPLRAAEFIIAGYCSVAPLAPAEVESLYMIARTRLAMRAVIGSWRLHHNDGRGDTAQVDDALTLLELLTSLGSQQVTTRWRAAAAL